ncbi:hypothetical protein QIR04_gp4 [ssRNA phage Gephyllon.1_25]|uniref:Uncharacterized protein n=2 Tax=Leviviricetes TaxID=2842243 RepID=A0A8S5KYV4_9VIRU|nr:hypothetical protein QIR04_gp4 [ssRNA phage Gephyllon.1_25]QDH88128.1 MAG: hypothetical protein H1BulkLitter6308_000004 [Leviviridae sp.]DAD50601.1 TPA_asm: hypothetical protein [ssRNA phage Gephyllon.1_25]
MVTRKQAYLLEHPPQNRTYRSFWVRMLLFKTEAARLRDIFGEKSLKGPFSPEDSSIVSGFQN